MFNPLQTPKEDLNSKLGMDLKRAMLLRLARKDTELYPHDTVKRERVYNKYKVEVLLFFFCLEIKMKLLKRSVTKTR